MPTDGPDAASAPAPAAASNLTSSLKLVSAYEDQADVDERFFKDEERPSIGALPIPAQADPLELDDYDDPEGTMFSGPAARSVPTSTSTFRMRSRTRADLARQSRELSRNREDLLGDSDDGLSTSGRSRRSRKGKRRQSSSSRRGSDATSAAASDLGDSDGESVTSAAASRKSTPRRKSGGRPASTRSRSKRGASRSSRPGSSDEDDDRPGFFRGISDALRGRPSFSKHDSATSVDSRPGSTRSKLRRRSSELDEDAVSIGSASEFAGDDDEDGYGPYGESDSTSTNTTNSSSSQDDGPRRRRGGGGFLGMPGAGDAFFGESRIDFEDASDDDGSADGDSPDERRKRSPNAQQSLYIPDEDLPLKLFGLRVSRVKVAAWTVGCVLSGGSLWLLGRWVPSVWLKGVGQPGEFEEASYVVIEVRRCFALEAAA